MPALAFTSAPPPLLEALQVLEALGIDQVSITVTATPDVTFVGSRLEHGRCSVKVDQISAPTAASRTVLLKPLRAALERIPSSITSCSFSYTDAGNNQGANFPASWTLTWGTAQVRSLTVQDIE